MRILFVDPCCPKPYDPKVLATEALGGTESTVIRVAEGLSQKLGGHGVWVTQHNRGADHNSCFVTPGGAYYSSFGHNENAKPTHVVVLRAPQALYTARKQFPNAKLYLWNHDIFGGEGWDKGYQAIVDTQAVPIMVSTWHQAQMYDHMNSIRFKATIPSRRIYNPIDNDLVPDDTTVDTNKIVFFSSPHKGLEHTLKVFEQFQNFDDLKDVKLYLANPGYFPDSKTELKNVVNLGALPHSEVINQVRSALCVFHLNNVFPETFGLVHAESNAVGTPFLSSRLGATPELADHPAELIDVQDPKAVIERIRQWRTGRPKVRANANFRLKNVIKEWIDLLKL